MINAAALYYKYSRVLYTNSRIMYIAKLEKPYFLKSKVLRSLKSIVAPSLINFTYVEFDSHICIIHYVTQ